MPEMQVQAYRQHNAVRQERTASVAYKWQGYPNNRNHSHRTAQIDQYMGKQNCDHAHNDELCEGGF